MLKERLPLFIMAELNASCKFYWYGQVVYSPEPIFYYSPNPIFYARRRNNDMRYTWEEDDAVPGKKMSSGTESYVIGFTYIDNIERESAMKYHLVNITTGLITPFKNKKELVVSINKMNLAPL